MAGDLYKVRMMMTAVVRADSHDDAQRWVERHERDGFDCEFAAERVETPERLPFGWERLPPFDAAKGDADGQFTTEPAPTCREILEASDGK